MQADSRKALARVLSRPISAEEKRIKTREMQDNPDDMISFMELYNRVFLAAPDPYRELTPEDVKKILTNDTIFLAEMYGKLIGFVVIVVYEGEEGDIGECVGEIASIGVMPNRRRVGVATALIRATAAYLADKGISRVLCEVYEENQPSYEMISSYGFEKIGERVIPKDGTPEEVEQATRMWKILR